MRTLSSVGEPSVKAMLRLVQTSYTIYDVPGSKMLSIGFVIKDFSSSHSLQAMRMRLLMQRRPRDYLRGLEALHHCVREIFSGVRNPSDDCTAASTAAGRA